MQALLSTLLPLVAALATALPARASSSVAKLDVVTTIPDLADIVKEVGGGRVDVDSITRGDENLHAVVARPTHLVLLSRADVYVQVGLSLESAFAPTLLLNARNQAIQPGAKGFVNVSDGWEAINVPASLSRQGGDLHPMGNPHMNLDPRAGRHMATVVRDALARIDPEGAATYAERFDAYAKELDAAEARWEGLRRPLAGKRIAVYHQEFNYLAGWYGLEIADTIELRPGIPPTPNHLAAVIEDMQANEVGVILIAGWSRNAWVERVADATGAKVVVLPNQTREGGTWIGTMDAIADALADAFGVARPGAAPPSAREGPGKAGGGARDG